jgi:hypothetical protein
MLHFSVILYFLISKNITRLYYLVSKSRNIALNEKHSLVYRRPGFTRRVVWVFNIHDTKCCRASAIFQQLLLSENFAVVSTAQLFFLGGQ